MLPLTPCSLLESRIEIWTDALAPLCRDFDTRKAVRQAAASEISMMAGTGIKGKAREAPARTPPPPPGVVYVAAVSIAESPANNPPWNMQSQANGL